MINPISPQFVKVIHEDKVREIEREIEFSRAASERWSYAEQPAWFERAVLWVKAKIYQIAPVAKHASRKGDLVKQPFPHYPELS